MRLMTMGMLAMAVVAGGAAVPARASDGPRQNATGPELGVAVLAHGIRKPFRAAPPTPGAIYESEEERGTADIEVVIRSAPVRAALQPRLTAKLQLNTDSRTSFASVGAEWRQHILHRRAYGQIGIGLAIHDGYLRLPDPFVPGLAREEAWRRLEVYLSRTGFGSRVLFNPNLSLGIRLSNRMAVEAVFEHYSHAGLLSSQNPGINMLGVRLVHGFSR